MSGLLCRHLRKFIFTRASCCSDTRSTTIVAPVQSHDTRHTSIMALGTYLEFFSWRIRMDAARTWKNTLKS